MKAIIFIAFIAVFLATSSLTSAKYTGGANQIHWWDTDNSNQYQANPYKRIPFPQCLLSKRGSKAFNYESIQELFDKKLRDEEKSLDYDTHSNSDYDKHGSYNSESYELRRGTTESRTAARAAIKVTRDLLTILMCDINGTNSDSLQAILDKFKIPTEFCSYLDKPDCTEKSLYRTVTGVCNNVNNPYWGSSQTAFKRYLHADYEDGLSEPRRKSSCGGLLPSCRYISLSLGSDPVYNRNYNNFFVNFGQMIAHDVALSVPVSDTYSRPIGSCGCNDKYDWDKCNIIPISPDDPYLHGQKCMAFPATAQAFKNQLCSLGVKASMNGNTHFADLSPIYGSTVATSEALRGPDGLLKSSRNYGLKLEMPPAQREGKSCVDSTKKRKCFAAGDTRLHMQLGLTGVHTVFLRVHNQLARYFKAKYPDWTSNQIFEEARAINIGFYQRIIYEEFLPMLLGKHVFDSELGPSSESKYDPTVEPNIADEFSTVAFRLHSLVRDLVSRCTYNAMQIDELWLHDIHHKSKYAYDIEHNGLDSILCGSFYDHGFAYDSNFAKQIQNRLFESNDKYNKLWRNDLIAINICRGREHGIPSYNELRKHCSLPKAESFTQFGDTMNIKAIEKLKKIYRCPDDVDGFVGMNMEDPYKDGVVGQVASCIIAKQFKDLRDGDRFHYHYEDGLTEHQLHFVKDYPLSCLLCKTVHIEEMAKNPFQTPGKDNPLMKCSDCDKFPFEPPASGKF